MKNRKNLLTIALIATMLCSCGIISKTRYGNGYKFSLSNKTFDKAPAIRHRNKTKPQLVNNFDCSTIVNKEFSPSAITISTTNQAINVTNCILKKNSIATLRKTHSDTKYNQQLLPFNFSNRFKNSSISGISKRIDIDDTVSTERETIPIFLVKVTLSIILFATIGALYIAVTVIGVLAIFITAGQGGGGGGGSGLFSFFYKLINKLAKISYKSIWRSWRRNKKPATEPNPNNDTI